MRAPILVAAAIALAACGGSNPGGGTRTLYVKAQAETDGTTDGTRLGLEVREGSSGGTLITDAVVILRGDKSGESSLPWQGLKWGDFALGSYFKSGIAWEPGWAIEVRRGNDRLDAYLQTPGYTTIVEPIAQTTFRRTEGKPLAVKWKDSFDRRAKTVTVDVDKAKYQRTLPEDPLSHEIEANRLVSENNERITLERVNEIELAGGTPGSIFRGTSKHRIEVNVE
ncbi:MAG: hypothetical protein HYZ28_18105 [Myxococcales bacterium]|nr:hypothetical protein [Myxococcales bacterium]